MLFGRRDPRFRGHFTAAAILVAGVALWLHFIYDIYQIHNVPYARTPSLLAKDHPLIPLSLGEGVNRLLFGLEPPYLLFTALFGLLAASVWPLSRGRMDWIGVGLIGLFVASFTLLMSLFRQVPLRLLATGNRFPMYPLGRRGRLHSETALPDGYQAVSGERSS